MLVAGITTRSYSTGAAPPAMDLKAVLEAQKARGGVSILTPPSITTADPDEPFLREGKAPGIWVMVRMGTPISAKAVKADFSPLQPEAKPAASEAEVAQTPEPKLEATEEAPVTSGLNDAGSLVLVKDAPKPVPDAPQAAPDEADQDAFDNIVSALKVIRGGEAMPWDGILATV